MQKRLLILIALMAFVLYAGLEFFLFEGTAQTLYTQGYNCYVLSHPLIKALPTAQGALPLILDPAMNRTAWLEQQYVEYKQFCKPKGYGILLNSSAS